MLPKLRVDIWSDIMCPFCYIGKRRFEAALVHFDHRDHLEVVWHSFQLDSTLRHQPDKDFYTYVAELKGQSREWSVAVHQNLLITAQVAGLNYRFDQMKITNSFDAHRLLQLAKKHKLSEQVEERFFYAYFTEGALLSDSRTLLRLATEAGLDSAEVEQVLTSNQYADEVREDRQQAQQLGASGVPFFVFNQRQVVAGAQSSGTLLAALNRAYAEWNHHTLTATIGAADFHAGAVCTPGGDCR